MSSMEKVRLVLDDEKLWKDRIMEGEPDFAGSQAIIVKSKATRGGRPAVAVTFETETGVKQTVFTARQWLSVAAALKGWFPELENPDA